MTPTWIELSEKVEKNGVLCVGEVAKTIPFPIVRFFFIHQVPEQSARGGHSLKNTEEVVFCLRDSCTLWLFRPDGREVRFDLDQSARGVYIPPGWWVELGNFKKDTILLALASQPFDPTDYVRRPDQFFHSSPYPAQVLRPRFKH